MAILTTNHDMMILFTEILRKDGMTLL